MSTKLRKEKERMHNPLVIKAGCLTFTPQQDRKRKSPAPMQTATFDQFTYERPQLDTQEQDFYHALDRFRGADSFSAAEAAMEEIYDIRNRLMTQYNIAHIRHTIDTRDNFYDQENTFYDENMPRTEAWRTDFYRALLASPFRGRLEERWGTQLFRIAELSLRTFDPVILSLLQEENRLSSEYVRLKAKAQLDFEGQTYNLSSIQVKELDADRDVRRRAAEVKWAFFADHAAELDRIYDELVRVRTDMARQLGFDNFIGLGYARMLRTDYSAADVARFRNAIKSHIVPLAQQLYDRQRERLGLDRLLHYDEEYRFPDGNPRPQGPPQWIVAQARRMYDELSRETGQFFHLMQERNLMDLVAKDGKATGGYCTFIPGYGTPYIFSNFNGTSGDIDVLTHEFGHAFQVYSSREIGISEYNWPTYEACEIHSMSMEFFTWPWMELFFKNETEKYRLAHLGGAIRFLPYGVAVDEFQHYVYENPQAGPAERNRAWRDLERMYLPQRDYDGHAYLEGGGFWQKQTHIYGMPFYYIDYTLAQICAFQFWLRDRQDHTTAWHDYVHLCRAGGSRSFLELVQLANLRSPFQEGVVAEVAAAVGQELRSREQ